MFNQKEYAVRCFPLALEYFEIEEMFVAALIHDIGRWVEVINFDHESSFFDYSCTDFLMTFCQASSN